MSIGIGIAIVVALAIVSGFWFSYYQSVRRLREHDRETVRQMEQELSALQVSGAPTERLAAARKKIDDFRAAHRVSSAR